MTKNHIKRINAPRRWDVARKSHTFITRPNPGRDLSLCISLGTVLKELLGKAKTTKEAKYIIHKEQVLVNQKRRYDDKFPVGFMDVVSLPSLNEHYRLLVNQKDRLFLLKINEAESKLKLSKIMCIKNLSGEIVQLNCSDGRNFLFKKGDMLLKEVKKNDSLLYTLPEQEIKSHLKMEKGCLAYLYKGKHVGNLVRVEDFKGENIVFKMGDEVFETKKTYAFVVGRDKPIISMGINQKA